MFKKILLMSLFFCVADLFVACCHCEIENRIYYKRCTLKIQNAELVEGFPTNTNGGTILADSFALNLHFIHNQNICEAKRSTLFISQTQACSCDGPYGEALDQFEEIKVFTVQNFDSLHAAGSDVSEYFSIYNWRNDIENSQSVEMAAGVMNAQTADNSYYFDGSQISFILNQTPDSVAERQFTIEVSMTDGRTYSTTSSGVVLN